MRGYPGQALFEEIAPVAGETRVLRGVPCTYKVEHGVGIYAGSRDGLTVTAWRSPTSGAWVVRVDVTSTVLVDDLSDLAVAS